MFNDFSTLRRQLLILGTPKTVGEWRFYAYECDGFVLMLPDLGQAYRPAEETADNSSQRAQD
jgi:hypothetical protein